MAKINFESLIVQQNDHFIIINKPPFISSLEDRSSAINILELARSYEHDAQLCHRLDKGTSGLLVIARHAEAYRWMAGLFEKREVVKTYHAVIEGVHQLKDLEISDPIHAQTKGTARVDHYRGKESQTLFNTIKAFRSHTLVECKPRTGRFHQIRVHLAFNNMPILGDTMYGGKEFYLSSIKKNYHLKKGTDEMPLIKRFALHAYRLDFQDPDLKTNKAIAEYPKDFEVLLKQLEKNS